MSGPSAGAVPPPPRAEQSGGRWAQLPPVNRRRLLQLLSQLLERQLRQRAPHYEEGGDDADGLRG